MGSPISFLNFRAAMHATHPSICMAWMGVYLCDTTKDDDDNAGVIGGVVAFTVAHVAKLILDWLATKTGCCAPATTDSPLEAAEEFHVTPNGDAKPPPTAAEPVSPAQTHPAMHIHCLNAHFRCFSLHRAWRMKGAPERQCHVSTACCSTGREHSQCKFSAQQ